MRSILFIDPPAFCATVERLVAPALRHRPLVVAPPGADRATVLALSPEARAAGIRPGMAVRLARKRCPDLVLVAPNPSLYARASRALHEILAVWAPVIEPRGYGHAFLDLTGTGKLFGPATGVADRIRREAWERLRLPLTVGVAVNKLVSEAATRVVRTDWGGLGRSGADGGGRGWMEADAPLLSVGAGEEAGFLAPRPVTILPEIPETIRRRLDDYQLDLIGEIAAIPEPDLCAVFGTAGRVLRARARGIDPRPVLPPAVRAEYRVAHTLATDTNDIGILHALLRRLVEQLGRRLRSRRLAARRLAVTVDFMDYQSASRSVPLREAMLDVELWDAARRALAVVLARRLSVRRVGVTLDRLVEAEAQLELWDGGGSVGKPAGIPTPDPSHRPAALQHAIDRITARWGARAMTRGR